MNTMVHFIVLLIPHSHESRVISCRWRQVDNQKTIKPDYNAVSDRFPIVGQSIGFLFDLHQCIDNADIHGLDQFVAKYSVCGIRAFETYAKGLKDDCDAIKNAILNRDINNGMIEGFNNKIKLLRKIRYGKAKEELLNAVSVLSTQQRFQYTNYSAVKYRCYNRAA